MKMNIPIKKDNETLDAFYHGKIRIIQKSLGYRFSIEAPLLADFIKTYPEDELIELGTANGIISLLVSIKPFKSLLALEIDLNPDDIKNQIENSGFYFKPYPGQSNYGISICSQVFVTETVDQFFGDRVKLIYHKNRGWDNHQDVYAFQKTSSPKK